MVLALVGNFSVVIRIGLPYAYPPPPPPPPFNAGSEVMQTPAEQLNWKMGAINTSEFICLIHDCSYVLTSTWSDRQGSVRMIFIRLVMDVIVYYCISVIVQQALQM